MRTTNSIKNITIVIITQIIMTLLGFISRKVFLDSLGTEYLGINGLLTNVLAMLALVESGIGTSIVYSLYKPLAENDKSKIIALIQLYKKAYAALAVIILILSIILYPLLGNLMKGSESVPYLTLAYFIFVAKNVVAYLNAHRLALINADQKGYVLAGIDFGFQVFTTIARIIVLILTQNYILYLLIELAVCIVQNIYSGSVVEKRYTYIKTKEKYLIDQEEKGTLIKNIKAMFLHNIGSYCVFGTDNILIASFVSVVTVGLYSNYTMIIGQLSSLVTPIIAGIGASVGNLIATEKGEKQYSIFRVSYLVNAWIYSLCVIFLYNLLEPFINWWLGTGYLLNDLTFILILVNFYLTGLRSSIGMFKSKAGIFVQDKYVPLIEAGINLGASLILVKYLGIAGIFLGTTISSLATVFWNVPRLVYKHVFNMPVWSYFRNYLFYAMLTIASCVIVTYICNLLVNGNSFMSLIAKGIICLIIPNLMYIIIFYKTKELQYIKNILSSMFLGVKIKRLFKDKVKEV
ncbi:lipopolysaccharide biosynthesis protein [Priestia aryabhattai]|uniref:lipopolysaccharide biosynthesis protein n=1 Tax=Priestia aryabhattai TaxID=412384 RepID=UPI000C075654|nr:oligosaccharide flippase family protein [Priestia aryabhattai]